MHVKQDEQQQCFVDPPEQYILYILEKYSLSEAKVISTPADINVKLKKDDGISKKVNSITYQSMVGS